MIAIVPLLLFVVYDFLSCFADLNLGKPVRFLCDLLKQLLVKENIDVNTEEFSKRLERAKNWVTEYGTDYQVNLLKEQNVDFYNTFVI